MNSIVSLAAVVLLGLELAAPSAQAQTFVAGGLLNSGALKPLAQIVSPPITPVPSGYGNYCSIVYPNRTWAFEFMIGSNSDPCGDINQRAPGGQIRHSGLWSEKGENNVMVRCDSGDYVYRAAGAAFLNSVAAAHGQEANCSYILSPAVLPVFGHPWGIRSELSPAATALHAHYGDPYFNQLADSDVSSPSGFNYDLFGQAWDVSIFGQQATPANNPRLGVWAVQVDRYGREQGHTGSRAECLATSQAPGCVISSSTTVEGAYDWSMPEGKPLLSVANGIVRGARNRNVRGFGCRTDTQAEIFIEYQVGSGLYAENFVACYHHMITGTSVNVGQVVTQGQVIGQIGNTGCSSEPHLDLSVIRLTNLTGIRKYQFQALPVNPNDPPSGTVPPYTAYGVNGVQGAIDPFGWAAPAQVDPYAWKFIGFQDPYYPFSEIPGLNAVGAFSLNLWQPGQAPPAYK